MAIGEQERKCNGVSVNMDATNDRRGQLGSPVVQFWIGAVDVEHVRHFYESVLGWRFQPLDEWDRGPIDPAGGKGIPGSYGPRRSSNDLRIELSVRVDDLEGTLAAAE